MAFLETILAGGATGLIGTAFTSVFNFIGQRQTNKHSLLMAEMDMKAMTAEAAAKIEITETKIQGSLDLAEMDNIKETLKQNAVEKLSEKTLDTLLSKNWTAPFGVLLSVLFGLLDFIKGIIRPGMTLYLTVLVTMIYLNAANTLKTAGVEIDPVEAQSLVRQIIDTVLYSFVTILFWWFGERAAGRKTGVPLKL